MSTSNTLITMSNIVNPHTGEKLGMSNGRIMIRINDYKDKSDEYMAFLPPYLRIGIKAFLAKKPKFDGVCVYVKNRK